MKITDFVEISDYQELYQQLIDPSILKKHFERLHYPTSDMVERQLIKDGGDRLAGYFNANLYRNAVGICFIYSVNRMKNDLNTGKQGVVTYVVKSPTSQVVSQTIGPAAFRHGNSVDVYGLHGVELTFQITNEEIIHTGVNVDWSSVDDKLLHEESVREISQRTIQDMIERANESAEGKGLSGITDRDADIELE